MVCVLFLDTTADLCEAAVFKKDVLVAHIKRVSLRVEPLSGFLPHLVREAVTTAGCTMNQITRLVVITGPGSFTGIRIGLAFAQGLALAMNVPLGSLTLFERLKKPTSGPTLMLRNTKCKTFYAAYYQEAHGLPQYEVIAPSHEWFEKASHIIDMDQDLPPPSAALLQSARWGSLPTPFYLKNPLTPS